MLQRRRFAITVICFLVALIGIGSIVAYSTSNKPTVLAANSQITPTPTTMTATLEVLEEPVYVMFPMSEAPETARTGMSVPQGTIVTTGTTGRAQIMYPGGTVTRLDNSTHVKLSTLNTQKYQIVVNIYQGRIWSRIKKLLGNESYETKTSNTVATVRGTSYEHSVTELDEDGVIVLEGKVDFGCNENQNLKASLDANKKALVRCKTDLTLTPEDVTPKDLDQEWVKFNKIKNKVLKDDLKKGVDPAASNSNKKVKEPTDIQPTNIQDVSVSDTKNKGKEKEKEKEKDKEKKNPSPTAIIQIKPTDIVGAVDSTVNAVITAIPTLPPLLRAPTTPVAPPTQAPAATATPAPPGNNGNGNGNGVKVNIDAGGLNVGVGVGKDGVKLNLGNGH